MDLDDRLLEQGTTRANQKSHMAGEKPENTDHNPDLERWKNFSKHDQYYLVTAEDEIELDSELNNSTSSEDLKNFKSEVLQRLNHDSSRKENNREVREDNFVEFEEPQFEDDEMFGFHTPKTEKNLKGASPRPNKNSGNPSLSLNNLQQPPVTGHNKIYEDDDLSTIAEISEPNSPSYDSSSRTLGDDSETPQNVTFDNEDENGIANFDQRLSNLGSRDIFGSVTSTEVSLSDSDPRSRLIRNPDFSELTQLGMTSSYTSDSHTCYGVNNPDVKGSFVVSDLQYSMESARAAGLPIIHTKTDRGSGWPISNVRTDRTSKVNNRKEQCNGQDNGSMSEQLLTNDRDDVIVGNGRTGSEAGSDFEEVPINIRPASQSSQSSSSGISADEIRYGTGSEGGGDRPGIAVYSSLSEQTGGSPNVDAGIGDDEIIAGGILHHTNDEGADEQVYMDSRHLDTNQDERHEPRDHDISGFGGENHNNRSHTRNIETEKSGRQLRANKLQPKSNVTYSVMRQSGLNARNRLNDTSMQNGDTDLLEEKSRLTTSWLEISQLQDSSKVDDNTDKVTIIFDTHHTNFD